MTKTSLAAAFALCAAAPAATADSLQDRKDHAAEQTRADNNLKAVNDACGSRIKWTFDWSTWKVASDENGHHAAESCGVALSAIKGPCNGDKTTQAAVAKQIKTIRCLGDAADAKVELKDGTLTVHTDLGGTKGDVLELTKQALKDSLK
jgi:hypothetical protein